MKLIFRPDPKPVKKPKNISYYKFKHKPTGLLDLYKEIWNERPHTSQISGEPLGEFSIMFFSHILQKGQNKYPKFKLNKQNIVLKTYDQHYLWEHNKGNLVTLPEWKWIFELEASLKEQYKKITTD